jgi:hypothetical protein
MAHDVEHGAMAAFVGEGVVGRCECGFFNSGWDVSSQSVPGASRSGCFLPSLSIAGSRPFRRGSPFVRVLQYVTDLMLQVFPVPDYMIVIFFLPETPFVP